MDENWWKSVSITGLVGTAVLLMLVSTWQMIQTGALSWVGLFLESVAVALYFANLYRFTTPRTTMRLTNVSAVILLGVVLATAGTLQADVIVDWVMPLAFVLMAWWLLYVNWATKLERPLNTRLVLGRTLPTFTLKDENGSPVSTSTLRGQKVLLLFYRGNWCPFCVAQIKELAASYQELAQRSVAVVLISPQSQQHTRDLAQKFSVPMLFWRDEGNRVARELHLVHENGVPKGFELLDYDSETVLPTVILLDEYGRIFYTSLTDNYRIRPEPAEYLRVLDGFAEAS